MELQNQGKADTLEIRNNFSNIMHLNDKLDRVAAKGLINESIIESYLEQLQNNFSTDDLCYWLLMMRMAELAVVCAGRYADACQFASTGDLLVNPRKIKVHQRTGFPSTVIKLRRGAISAQFNTSRFPHHDFINWMQQNTFIQTVEKPLLTFFIETMETSTMIGESYLSKIRLRLARIADTVAFLTSWQINNAADLHTRLHLATPDVRRFIESHLCNFNLNLFNTLGCYVRIFAMREGNSGAVRGAEPIPTISCIKEFQTT